METWVSSHAPDEETLKLASEALGQDRFQEALLPRLKQYVAEHPEDRASRLRVATLQLESGGDVAVAEALEHLWMLAAGEDAESLAALDLLTRTSRLPPEDLGRLIKRLQEHPRSQVTQRVHALKLQTQLRPDQRRAVFAQAVSQFQGANREELATVTRWLVDEREFAEVLALVDETTATGYQPLLENYLSSLTGLGRLADLQRLVQDPRVTGLLNRATLAFYQLHLDFVLQKPVTELRKRMKTATLHAEHEGRSELLLAIGNYGEARAMADLAEPAFKAALRSRRTQSSALQGLLRATRRSGNTAGHLEALEKASAEWPDNQDYRQKLLYLRLLLGLHLETSVQQAEQLLERDPRGTVPRFLTALGWARLRNPEQAALHLRQLDADSLEPGQRIVLASLARAHGLGEEASTWLRSVPTDADLFPQERSLLAALTP